MTTLPEELLAEVALVDAAIRPIAKRPVSMGDPNWRQPARSGDPLDQAGVKARALAALDALIRYYAGGDEETRAAVRTAFDEHTSFRWATFFPLDPTPAGFRFRLLHLSAKDHDGDTRDLLVSLWNIVQRAEEERTPIAGTLREVGELSSDVNRYGMGSVRQILLAQAEREAAREKQWRWLRPKRTWLY